PTDFPSANFLLAHGISRILLIQDQPGSPQPDLAHTLRRWQEAKLAISQFIPQISQHPEPIVIHRPPWFRHFWYGLIARIGLRRSPLGGFGGFIPQPSSG